MSNAATPRSPEEQQRAKVITAAILGFSVGGMVATLFMALSYELSPWIGFMFLPALLLAGFMFWGAHGTSEPERTLNDMKM